MDRSKTSNRIVFLTYSLVGGGAEKNTVELASKLYEKGWNCDIMSFKPIVDYKENIKDNAGRIRHYSLLKTTGKLSFGGRLLILPQFIGSLMHFIHLHKYRILVGSLSFYPFYLAVLGAKLTGAKSIQVIGSSLKEELSDRPYVNRLMHWFLHAVCFWLSDSIICVSEGLRNEITIMYPFTKKKSFTIYNGVDKEKIEHAKRKPADKAFKAYVKNSKIIVFAGRLSKEKNPAFLLKTFNRIVKNNPSVKLVIFGKGELKEALELYIKQQHLDNKVILMGFASNLYSYLKYADLLAVPSLREGFGNVIVEAMAVGIPVVSMDCDYGPREVLKDKEEKFGLLAHGKEEFETALTALLNDGSLRKHFSIKGLKRVEYFTLDKMASYYDTVFRRLLK